MQALSEARDIGFYGTIEHAMNNSKGCGGLMRVAPVGLVCGEDSFRIAAECAAD